MIPVGWMLSKVHGILCNARLEHPLRQARAPWPLQNPKRARPAHAPGLGMPRQRSGHMRLPMHKIVVNTRLESAYAHPQADICLPSDFDESK